MNNDRSVLRRSFARARHNESVARLAVQTNLRAGWTFVVGAEETHTTKPISAISPPPVTRHLEVLKERADGKRR
jgi:hypothetical protein